MELISIRQPFWHILFSLLVTLVAAEPGRYSLAEEEALGQAQILRSSGYQTERLNESFASAENGIDINEENDPHERSRRAIAIGTTVPANWTFTLEALPPFHTEPANFSVGSVISYKLTIWASIEDMNVTVSFYSQTSGGSYFMISNIRFGKIGSNFVDFNTTDKEVIYDSKYKDGRWDSATIELGNVSNWVISSATADLSKMEILFEAQALNHSGFVVGNKYRVSVGCLFGLDQDYITVAQDDLTFINSSADCSDEPTFEIAGPTNLSIHETGVWTVYAYIPDRYSTFTMDVLAPIYKPGVMSVDRVSIASVGRNYKYSFSQYDSGNMTSIEFEEYGDYMRFELGTIVNGGYFSNGSFASNYSDNLIVAEIAITMLDHVFNSSENYSIGFAVWKADADGVDILWSTQQTVIVDNSSLPALVTSPSFNLYLSSNTVKVGGVFSALLNMTVPSGSISKYQVEVSGAVNGSMGLMDILRLRLSRVGFNMPHMSKAKLPAVNFSSEDGTNRDYAFWDLGYIHSTGKRNGPDDNTIQVEIAVQMTSNVLNYYAVNGSVPLLVGMRHDNSYYWLGRIYVTITTDDIEYSADKAPIVNFYNRMGDDDVIYTDSAVVLDLDVVIPAAVDYSPVLMSVNTLYGATSNKTKLNIRSIEVVKVGDALISTINDTYLNTVNDDVDINSQPMHNSGWIKLERVTSLRDVEYPRYYTKESTVTIRTTIVARGDMPTELLDNTTHWVELTTTFDSKYIFASRLALQYRKNFTDMYNGTHWQPYIGVQVMPESSERVQVGGIAIFNVTIGVPYRTVTDALVTATGNSRIQVCSVRPYSVGSAIVDYTPYSYTGPQSTGVGNFNKTVNLYQPVISSHGVNWYYDSYSSDTYVTYRVVANLLPTVVNGSNGTFPVSVRVQKVQKTLSVAVTADDTAKPVRDANAKFPTIHLGHYGGTNKINLGGQELFYMDIYVPPNVSESYTATFYAPHDQSLYGQIEVVEGYIASVGSNLGCWYYEQAKMNISASVNNTSGRKNKATFNLGFLYNDNFANNNITDIQNRVRLLVLVSIHGNSTLTAGTESRIAASLDLSGGYVWIGTTNFTVIDPSDEANVDVTNASAPSLVISALGDQTFTVGETQRYSGKITIPPGVAVTQMKVFVDAPLSSEGEALLAVSNVTIVSNSSGKHLPVIVSSASISLVYNSVNQITTQIIEFGFVRNTKSAFLSKYVLNGTSDNTVDFTFSLRLMDDAMLVNNYQFDMTTRIEYGSVPTVVPATGAISVTAVVADTDAAVLSFSPSIVNASAERTQDSVAEIILNFNLEETSRRFPENLTITIGIPSFSQLIGNLSLSSGHVHLSSDNNITARGLKIKVDKLRYGDGGSVTFSFMIDPDKKLQPGLRNRVMSLPVDISYYLPNKTDPLQVVQQTAGIKYIRFPVFIAEQTAALGMHSGSINDCQITSSSHDGVNTPELGRLFSSHGWVSSDRGPPFYQNEYVQVAFSGQVRFTGITIQPFNDASAPRVLSFKIQYSLQGMKWNYVYDESRNVKVFDVPWPGSPSANTTAFVDMGSLTFVGKLIRIIPFSNSESSYSMKMRFELHGAPFPRGTSLPPYSCPDPELVLKPYFDRQVLFVTSDVMFGCMIPEPGKLPYCSGSRGSGVWFAVDDNVMNVLGYSPSEPKKVYGLARNRKHILRSTDLGLTWYAVDETEFNTASSNPDFVTSKPVPFPPVGNTVAELYGTYGPKDGSSYWSVSRKALHKYLSDPATSGSLTDSDDQVAFWGDGQW